MHAARSGGALILSNSPEQSGGERLQDGGRDWGWIDMHLDTQQAQRMSSRITISVIIMYHQVPYIIRATYTCCEVYSIFVSNIYDQLVLLQYCDCTIQNGCCSGRLLVWCASPSTHRRSWEGLAHQRGQIQELTVCGSSVACMNYYNITLLEQKHYRAF